MQEKEILREKKRISTNRSTKKRYKNKSYQRKNSENETDRLR